MTATEPSLTGIGADVLLACPSVIDERVTLLLGAQKRCAITATPHPVSIMARYVVHLDRCHAWPETSHMQTPGTCTESTSLHVGKGGTNWGPNTLNMSNTTERGTSSKEPWDEEACARLLNETVRILEETTGDKLPVP